MTSMASERSQHLLVVVIDREIRAQCLWAVQFLFCGDPSEQLDRHIAGLSVVAERSPGGWKIQRSVNIGPAYASE
jgi:hypothetical protein